MSVCIGNIFSEQTGQVHLGRKFLTNNPEYAGKFWLYDNNQLIEQEPFEQPDTDNEPQPSWRGEDVELLRSRQRKGRTPQPPHLLHS